ncbi:single-stranded DNA-binding protein [Brevibacterium linens ATCC 9172]|nr:single-stranded DNA-binding protein [Brevibacterium linens]KAB1949186.1 single-stranded DNA-binding protein [Brevibacterium linens ATCC 9172]
MRTPKTAWSQHTDLESPMSAIPITVTGTIATEPTARTLPSGRACASFRLAVNHWRVDKSTGEFIDDGTSWFGVDCYGELASNSATSLTTGAAVIVSGSLRNREWATEERSGISPTVVAEHIGPDLRYGTAHYQRAKASDRSQPPATQANTVPTGSHGAAWDALAPTPPDTGTGDSESLASRGPDGATGTNGEDDHTTEAEGGTERDVATDAPGTAGADSKPGDADDAIARETAKAAAPF